MNRSGYGSSERVDMVSGRLCLNEGVVGGGWTEVPDLSGCQSRSDVERLVREVFGTEKPARMAVNNGRCGHYAVESCSATQSCCR